MTKIICGKSVNIDEFYVGENIPGVEVPARRTCNFYSKADAESQRAAMLKRDPDADYVVVTVD